MIRYQLIVQKSTDLLKLEISPLALLGSPNYEERISDGNTDKFKTGKKQAHACT